jgi:hypothetical protein
LSQIQSQAAISADVRHLMAALLPLARVARYGDVRSTEAADIVPILTGMFERAVVGLPAACSALDDEAAAQMLAGMSHVQQALDILNRDDLQRAWQGRIRSLMHSDIHALLRGSCCRFLLEKRQLESDELYRTARLALSPANPPGECAAWASGLLRGNGLLLLHQDGLWEVFDRWLCELPQETFVEMLPLVRRAFADFTHAERRQMGEKVKHIGAEGRQARPRSRLTPGAEVNLDRAALALPVLAHILGVPYDGDR